jgi:hypothetical protein
MAMTRSRPPQDGRISGHDVWGWGFAGLTACYGYPQDPGWVFTNAPRIDDYYRQLDAGRFRRVRGGRGAGRKTCFGLPTFPSGPRRAPRCSPPDEITNEWVALTAASWQTHPKSQWAGENDHALEALRETIAFPPPHRDADGPR